jgi:replication factor A1
MSDVEDTASDIVAQFNNHSDISQSDIEEQLKDLRDEYSIPLTEAKRVLKNQLEEDLDTNTAFDPTPMDEIDTEGNWIDLRAEVIELWEPRHESMEQVGLLGDESGTTKFTLWENRDPEFRTDTPRFEEGETYHIRAVSTDEYEGRYSVELGDRTVVEPADEDSISNSSNSTTKEGLVVDMRTGSGLIKRCPNDDCTRVLQNGRCNVHGEVDGNFDLRIKAYLDDGHAAQKVVFDEEATTELTGITLDDAKQMAKDALDTSVVANEIQEIAVGQYLEITGPVIGENLLVDEMESTDSVSEEHLEALKDELEAGPTASEPATGDAPA